METLLHVGLSNALAAAALALVAVAVGSVCRRPALVHGLWLLVLLKLVTPPLVPVRIPWPDAPEAVAPAPRPAEPSPPAVLPELPAGEDLGREEAVGEEVPPAALLLAGDDPGEENEAPAPANLPEPAPAPAVAPGTWMDGLAVVWLAGSAGWFALAGLRLWRFGRLLRSARPAPTEVRELARGLARQVGLSRCPAVWLLPGRVPPMLWAVGGRPRLLLPAELIGQVSTEGWTTLLLHELAHLRRRDHWVRGLEFLVMGLYWWHPVVWYARRELREAEEQCCDAWVVATLPGARRAYAAALLDTLDFLSIVPPAVPPLASGLGQVTDLKRRLTMIMRGTTPRALGWQGCLAVLFLGGLLLPLLPTWVRAEPEKEQKQELKKPFVRDAEPDAPAPQDLKKAEADLRRLEADIKQKLAEIERAKALVEQRKAVQKALAATRARVDEQREAAEGAAKKARAEHLKAHIATEGKVGRAIHLEIIVQTDGNEVKDVLRKIQQLLPSARVLMRVEGPRAENEFRVWRVGPVPTPKIQPPPLPPTAVLPRGKMPPAMDGQDRGMDNLEKRLDVIVKQLEELRREIRRAGPQ